MRSGKVLEELALDDDDDDEEMDEAGPILTTLEVYSQKGEKSRSGKAMPNGYR